MELTAPSGAIATASARFFLAFILVDQGNVLRSSSKRLALSFELHVADGVAYDGGDLSAEGELLFLSGESDFGADWEPIGYGLFWFFS